MVPVLGAIPPISVHNISRAIALRHRNPTSRTSISTAHRSLRGRLNYLCGDDIELEFLPVVVGLLECLNLHQISDIEKRTGK